MIDLKMMIRVIEFPEEDSTLDQKAVKSETVEYW